MESRNQRFSGRQLMAMLFIAIGLAINLVSRWHKADANHLVKYV
jgi:hypothetical protein